MKRFVLRKCLGIVTLLLVVLGWQIELVRAADTTVAKTVEALSLKKSSSPASSSRLARILRDAMRAANEKGIAAARTLLQGHVRMGLDQEAEVYVQMLQATPSVADASQSSACIRRRSPAGLCRLNPPSPAFKGTGSIC